MNDTRLVSSPLNVMTVHTILHTILGYMFGNWVFVHTHFSGKVIKAGYPLKGHSRHSLGGKGGTFVGSPCRGGLKSERRGMWVDPPPAAWGAAAKPNARIALVAADTRVSLK